MEPLTEAFTSRIMANDAIGQQDMAIGEMAPSVPDGEELPRYVTTHLTISAPNL